MVIGAAGELPKPPSTPIVFLEGEFMQLIRLEYIASRTMARVTQKRMADTNLVVPADMDDSELAQAVNSLFLVLFSASLT